MLKLFLKHVRRIFLDTLTLSKILCKWKQDSVVNIWKDGIFIHQRFIDLFIYLCQFVWQDSWIPK